VTALKKESQDAILFVDDELLILLSMSNQVKRNFGDRFRYLTAQTANEALELIKEIQSEGLRILLVFSDWSMPGINGDEFLKTLYKTHPQINKVIVTGYADQKALNTLKTETNLKYILRKPWEEFRLLEIINSVLEERQ
jgi:DNA-binding NtrC family response regulator